MLSSTATAGWSSSLKRSWKLDSSTTATSMACSATSDSAVPMLPATTALAPPSSSMLPMSPVTVVLPLVPVTPTKGARRWRAANSTSLTSGMPASKVSTMGTARSRMPGLVTTRSIPVSRSSVQAPTTTAMPSASNGGATSGSRS